MDLKVLGGFVPHSGFADLFYISLKPQHCPREITRSITCQSGKHQARRVDSGFLQDHACSGGPFACEDSPVDRGAISGVAACHKDTIRALLEGCEDVGWIYGPRARDDYRN